MLVFCSRQLIKIKKKRFKNQHPNKCLDPFVLTIHKYVVYFWQLYNFARNVLQYDKQYKGFLKSKAPTYNFHSPLPFFKFLNDEFRKTHTIDTCLYKNSMGVFFCNSLDLCNDPCRVIKHESSIAFFHWKNPMLWFMFILNIPNLHRLKLDFSLLPWLPKQPKNCKSLFHFMLCLW